MLPLDADSFPGLLTAACLVIVVVGGGALAFLLAREAGGGAGPAPSAPPAGPAAQPVFRPTRFRAVRLCKVYRGAGDPVTVLNDATFRIDDGVTALVGGSGTGKSTVL